MVTAQKGATYLESKPRTLAGLMDLYELNYIYLRKLIPTVQHMDRHAVSRSGGNVDLHFHLVERSRYTTTLLLTHYFCATDGLVALPHLTARLYHDARLAAVLEPRAGIGRSRLDALWRTNRFLQKWLLYCLGTGHGFAATTPPATLDVAR